MAKWVSATVLDGALSVIASATRMVALAGQPSNFAEAQAGRLAEAVLAPGEFTNGPGETSGRRIAVPAKTGVPVLASGTADHVALLDPGQSRLLYVTTCPPQSLVAGGTVNFASWSIEIGDPV
ncbi:MAG: hypothetical protein NZM40_10140 [Sphingomonadaceae bacterium]|uniref:hypothetical protein n=1 Tax=Thermaurantiacus sp. TaxID=2820283 RepID=UPI00298EEFF5|nr:hypothetical protein [Thermaurantiacus sp.]MCS6987763.1 hypothetical protein [Sphingomonadaceae bacterium]MDW8415016.1 hypothetical protein [Thermaurantiacus sp.]